jgi:hypothetical protein
MVDATWFVQVIAFIGALAGVSYRTFYPYLEKAKEIEAEGGKPISFLHKYKITAVISFIVASVTALSVYSTVPVSGESAGNLGALFIQAFFAGIGTNELLNRVSYKKSDSEIETKAAEKEATS